MTYEELKAAYEAAVQKCSELENEIDELKKSNEDKDLHIEHLEEQILKRNKMLFGQKSEKSKFICNGQMDLDGNVFNEAEELEREARKANVPPEKILEMRQKEAKPIIEEFYNFIGTLRPSKGSHLGAAVTYALNQKDKLLLFLGSVDTKIICRFSSINFT